MCGQARLHAAPTDWWRPPFKHALRELLPLLNGEPDASPLYMMAAFCDHKGQSRPYSAEEHAQLAELMAVLPRPVGQLANRLVTVHGETTLTTVHTGLASLSTTGDHRR